MNLQKGFMPIRKMVERARFSYRGIYIGVSMTVVFFGISFFYGLNQMRQNERAAAFVDNISQVIKELQTIETGVLKLVTARRGYFIVKEKKFLDAYMNSIPPLYMSVAKLETLNQDNENFINNVLKLKTEISDLIYFYQSNIHSFAVPPNINYASDKVESITKRIELMKIDQNKLLKTWLQEAIPPFIGNLQSESRSVKQLA